MNSTHKKPHGAQHLPQQVKPPARPAHQFKPAVAQLKNAVSAQSIKKPVAPPVYCPQTKPVAAQAKMAGTAQRKTHPRAPTLYPPQPVPKGLQAKTTVTSQLGQRPQNERAVAARISPSGSQRMRPSGQGKNVPETSPASRRAAIATPPSTIQRSKTASSQSLAEISKGQGNGGSEQEEQEMCISCQVNPPQQTLACDHRLCNACVIGISKAASQVQEYDYGTDVSGLHLVSLPYQQKVVCPICRGEVSGSDVRMASWQQFRQSKGKK
jgi:hypothetical protein